MAISKQAIILLVCALLAGFITTVTSFEVPGLEVGHDLHFEESGDSLTAYEYSQDDARIFARLSAAAYCAARDRTRLEDWSCQACHDSGIKMDRVSKFRVASTDMYGYVAYSRAYNRIFLVFRGSSNIANWMTNIDFAQVDYDFAPGIKVHGGFMKAYKFARPIIIGILDSLYYEFPNATLSISGHSLAGAIASHAIADFSSGNRFEVYNLAGVQFVRNGSPYDDELPFTQGDLLSLRSAGLQSNTDLLTGDVLTGKYTLQFPMYTFGAPRIGDAAWATWFTQVTSTRSVFRVVHNEDPVPHLPNLSMGFKHFATEVYYNDDESKFVVCGEVGEDDACSNQHWLPMRFDNHLRYLNYHVGFVEGTC